MPCRVPLHVYDTCPHYNTWTPDYFFRGWDNAPSTTATNALLVLECVCAVLMHSRSWDSAKPIGSKVRWTLIAARVLYSLGPGFMGGCWHLYFGFGNRTSPDPRETLTTADGFVIPNTCFPASAIAFSYYWYTVNMSISCLAGAALVALPTLLHLARSSGCASSYALHWLYAIWIYIGTCLVFVVWRITNEMAKIWPFYEALTLCGALISTAFTLRLLYQPSAALTAA